MNLQDVAWQADDRKMCHPLPALQRTNHIIKGGGGGAVEGARAGVSGARGTRDTHTHAHTHKKRARCR